MYSLSKDSYKLESSIEKAVIQVRSIPDNKIATILNEEFTILILDPTNSSPIKVVEPGSGASSVLYMKERNVLISLGHYNNDLDIWNISTYQNESTIEDIMCNNPNSLYQIDKDRVVVGHKAILTIVNIATCKMELKFYLYGGINSIFSFCNMRDDNLLCGCDGGKVSVFNIKTNKYNNIKTTHKDKINALLRIDEHTMISCSDDKTIKIWKY